MLWTNKQDDVVGVLGVQPGDDVLEVGYGPCGLGQKRRDVARP